MNGSMRFKEAPDPIRTRCDQCEIYREFRKSELSMLGLKPNEAMPDVLHGLGRLAGCKRAARENANKYDRCRLSYVDLWGEKG